MRDLRKGGVRHRRGRKGKQEHGEREQRHLRRPRPTPGQRGTLGRCRPVSASRIAQTSQPTQKNQAITTSAPTIAQETKRCSPGDGKDQMAAVELSAGKQIQSGGQHSSPTRQRHRMQVVVTSEGPPGCRKGVTQLKDQGKAELQLRVWAPATGCDIASPASMVGPATTNPAIGPAMPISNSAARDPMKPPMRMNFAHFTPIASLAGGLMIGGAAALMILGVGRILGAAGLYAGLVLQPGQSWRFAWFLALVASPLVAQLLWTLPPPVFPGTAATIGVAGLLVGFGSRLGSGCTSGHGVCGLARLSPRSFVATLIFMATAFCVVSVLRHVLA